MTFVKNRGKAITATAVVVDYVVLVTTAVAVIVSVSYFTNSNGRVITNPFGLDRSGDRGTPFPSIMQV